MADGPAGVRKRHLTDVMKSRLTAKMLENKAWIRESIPTRVEIARKMSELLATNISVSAILHVLEAHQEEFRWNPRGRQRATPVSLADDVRTLVTQLRHVLIRLNEIAIKDGVDALKPCEAFVNLYLRRVSHTFDPADNGDGGDCGGKGVVPIVNGQKS